MFILGSPARAIVEGDDVDSYENESSEFSTVIIFSIYLYTMLYLLVTQILCLSYKYAIKSLAISLLGLFGWVWPPRPDRCTQTVFPDGLHLDYIE